MSAWKVENRWDPAYATRFSSWVPSGVQAHSGKLRFTCEDLAVQLIIDFAVNHKLPLKIKNGSRSLGYVSGDFDSREEYRLEVMSSTGARDLLLDGNTLAVGSGTPGLDSDLIFAQAGDMIVMNDGSYRHVQIITHVRTGQIEIAQGNFRDPTDHCSGGDGNDPADKCYLGAHIQKARYELRDGRWRYIRPRSDEMVFQKKQARIRRWNFMSFNPPPVDPRSKMLLGPGARPGRRW